MLLNYVAWEDSWEPWTERRSNQSILKEINPGYSLKGLMLKLKLQYFGHLMRRTDSGKDPDARKDWRQEEKGTTEDEVAGWHHWLDGHEFEQAPGVGDGQGGLACCSPWVAKSQTGLSDWAELNGPWGHYVNEINQTGKGKYCIMSFICAVLAAPPVPSSFRGQVGCKREGWVCVWNGWTGSEDTNLQLQNKWVPGVSCAARWL